MRNGLLIGRLAQEQLAPSPPTPSSVSSQKAVTTTESNSTASEPVKMEVTPEQMKKDDEAPTDTNIVVTNPCVLCGKEEKRLAAIPCGHLVSCVKCSQTLRTCPICRHSIEAFVRIFI